jgi:glycerate-2-kinase
LPARLRLRNSDTGDFDVPFDDPATIASGPTVPDTTTLADAREIVARYRIKADDAVIAALNDPANESCKPGDAAFANSDSRSSHVRKSRSTPRSLSRARLAMT